MDDRVRPVDEKRGCALRLRFGSGYRMRRADEFASDRKWVVLEVSSEKIPQIRGAFAYSYDAQTM